MEDLIKKRQQLESKLQRMQDMHSKKFTHIPNEGAYQDSVKAIRECYNELSKVCDALGDPIPVWM